MCDYVSVKECTVSQPYPLPASCQPSRPSGFSLFSPNYFATLSDEKRSSGSGGGGGGGGAYHAVPPSTAYMARRSHTVCKASLRKMKCTKFETTKIQKFM